MTAKDPPSGETVATEGMLGQGYYDSHSGAQKDMVQQQAARLRHAVRHLALTGPEVRIVDYGCGPGRSSMAAFHIVLDELRGRDPDLPVVAVHNDQPGNDWNGLFSTISGPSGYLPSHPGVRVEASVGSFFSPVASAASVDLGLSFAAAHWLSRPVSLPSPGSLFFCDLPEPAKSELSQRAAQDWTTFLRQRARELKPGGWLVMDALSAAPDPADPSGLRAAGRGLYRAFWRIAADLAQEGKIDQEVLDRFVFPLYFRSSEQVRSPLERDRDLRAAFEIVELTNALYPMAIEADYQQSRDAKAYGAAYGDFAWAFAESTLRQGLFDPSTGDAAASEALAAEYHRRLQALFTREPQVHGFEHQVVTLVLRRR